MANTTKRNLDKPDFTSPQPQRFPQGHGDVRLPLRKAGLVRASSVKRWHVGVQARNDLNDGEPLGHPVGRQFLEVFRPTQPATQSHPPSISQPEEGCTVFVLEVPAVRRHSHWPVFAVSRESFLPFPRKTDGLPCPWLPRKVGDPSRDRLVKHRSMDLANCNCKICTLVEVS